MLSAKTKYEKGFYSPRPVMKKTTETEVNIYVVGYEINKEIPICGDDIKHATRYWVIRTLQTKYPKVFTMAKLSRHFGICPRVFETKKKAKFEGDLNDFGGLSPAEFDKTTYKSVVKAYGRPKDNKKRL